MYMYGGLLMAATSLVTALILLIIQTRYQHHADKMRWIMNSELYLDYLRERERVIKDRCEEIRGLWEQRYVSAESFAGIREPVETLWNRTPSHHDYLICRLGLGDRALPVQINVAEKHFRLQTSNLERKMYALKEKYKILTAVPVLVSLKEYTQVGLAAKEERDRLSLARNMILHFAYHNCYTETRIGLVYDEENCSCKENWGFLRWLPHVWSESGDFRLLASNQEEARGLFYRLLPVIRKREESKSETLPVYILFIAAPYFLEGEPVEKYLIRKGSRNNISVVWLAAEPDLLPRSCDCIIEDNAEFSGFHELSKGDRTGIAFDFVSVEKAEDFSRVLSLFRVHERTESTDIPTDVTFLKMLDADYIEELDIRSFWKKNKVMDSLRAPVGLMAGGKKKYLDIHEKYHGPHGLVAGTTGSGKSELLQTYLLSLLILYGPESVNLFLIDYKGGGMAGMFEGLPHLCGQISNLSGAQIARAMTALRSENKRRQRIFARYQVNSISDYMKLCYRSEDMEPMPHLLIIIDEFAELKKEEPEFMQGLISVAQVGRSLGLHLILATQKPGGIVDDTIWSNSRFRMCLRVQEKQDSMDMLHKPDAADLQQTGRCCFQVGNDEIYEIFQTGWSGAPYWGRDFADRNKSARLISFSGAEDMSRLRDPEGSDRAETQFAAVKRFIMEYADREGYPMARQLWMEPLPKKLFLSDVLSDDGTEESSEHYKDSICVGLVDDPANQTIFPVYLGIDVHTVVCGLPMTGKSTFLQTLLYGIVSRFGPKQVHAYVIDYSNGAMKAFEDMPQVGGVITEGQEQRCRVLFNMLKETLEERRKLFAGANYMQYTRTLTDKSVPRILLFIDNFASFNEKTGGTLYDILIRLCKEGANAGITLFVSCGGFSSNELPVRLSEFFKTAFCLELKEKYSYAEVLGSLNIDVIPEKGIPGRGIVWVGERILEFHTALAVKSTDDYERMRLIAEEAARQKGCCKDQLPPPVKSISKKLKLSEFMADSEVKDMLVHREQIPVSYILNTARVAAIFGDSSYCFLVGGRKKSGKHNLMRVIISMLKSRKREEERKKAPVSEINIIDFAGRFEGCKQDGDIRRYIDDAQGVYDYFSILGENFKTQKAPCYILIEDLGALLSDDLEEKFGVSGFLSNAWETGAGYGVYFAAILKGEDSFLLKENDGFHNFISYGTGIHLGGNLAEDLAFSHEFLSFAQQTETLRPGNGYFFMGDRPPEKIIVPGMGK